MEVVVIKDLCCTYDGFVAIDRVNMVVNKGEFVAIMGPNGGGKTTLLRAIAGMIKPRRGYVKVKGEIGYMPQKEHVNFEIPIKVREVVEMGIMSKKKKFSLFSKLSREEKELVNNALKAVDMLKFVEKNFTELSGGQQQRVLLARAIATKPDILLLDEPFNGVDLPTQEKIIKLLDNLASEGVSVITVVHNVSPLIHHISRIALLNRELIAYGKPEEVLTPENTAKAYGIPIPTTVCEEGYIHPLFGDIHG